MNKFGCGKAIDYWQNTRTTAIGQMALRGWKPFSRALFTMRMGSLHSHFVPPPWAALRESPGSSTEMNEEGPIALIRVRE
jgi:hypothetical protein